MSFDLSVRRFADGDAAAMDSRAFHTVWPPHTERTEPANHFWFIRTSDGGEADIYADVVGPTFTGCTLTRFSPGAVLDLLHEFLVAADAVVLGPGLPTMLVRTDQQRHQPEEIREDVALVGRGLDIDRVLQAG